MVTVTRVAAYPNLGTRLVEAYTPARSREQKKKPQAASRRPTSLRPSQLLEFSQRHQKYISNGVKHVVRESILAFSLGHAEWGRGQHTLLHKLLFIAYTPCLSHHLYSWVSRSIPPCTHTHADCTHSLTTVRPHALIKVNKTLTICLFGSIKKKKKVLLYSPWRRQHDVPNSG